MSEITDVEIKKMTKEQNYLRGYSDGRADAIDECKEFETVDSIVNSSFMNSDMKVLALQRWLQEWGGANKNVKEQDK